MSFLGRWRRRHQTPPVLDPPGYRRSVPLPPRPFEPTEPTEQTEQFAPISHEPVPNVGSGPSVRLVMADGTVQSLPADPELEARAAYLVRSMLSPPPPPPPGR